MTKTTFLGYVPSLKSKHEATIVNGRAMKSKGGSIRYLLEGEYDGRKTLPKTVSKEDFVKVYGFDAKEAEAVIISGTKNGDVKMRAHKIGQEEKDGFVPKAIAPIESKVNDISEDGKEFYENHADTVGSPSPADVEPPAPSEKPFPQEPSNENFSAETEVKEALGLFGKKEEEKEESDEPKTQEFTVVLQEGDKLELTDIEEEQVTPEDEKTEKEAESPKTRTFVVSSVDYETDGEELDLPQDFTFVLDVDGIHGIGDTTDMQEIADEIVDDISDETGFLVSGFYFQERMPDGTLVSLDAETYEAVQAKVTRPVKEDETEEKEESDEGLSTGAKVALGVGALAAGVALFGAEEDDYDPYESETDYSRIYEASVHVGEKRVMSRKDYDIDNELSGFSNLDYSIHLDEHEDEIAESVEDTLIDAIRESVDENLPISDGDSGSGSVNVDTEIEISVPISGDIDYEWDATINHEDDEHDEDWNAEHESETDGYTYAYTKGHKDGMDNEVIYRPSIETDREKTIFKKILKQKADTVDFNRDGLKAFSKKIENEKKKLIKKAKRSGFNERFGEKETRKLQDSIPRNLDFSEQRKYGDLVNEFSMWAMNLDLRDLEYLSETVGSPSPSGPSSTPEPAEATGSEPSNEHMEAEGSNMKMAMGVLALGVGAVALLGGDRIKKIFDRFNL